MKESTLRRFAPLSLLLAFLAASVISACGGDDDDQSDDGQTDDGQTDDGADQPDASSGDQPDAGGGGAPDAAASDTFACSFEDCELGTQYCLISLVNGIESVVQCVDLPEDCTSCSCASEDAPEQFPTSNNCSDGAVIACSQGDEAITVECSR